MITKIDHIGIAVKNVEESLKVYCNAMGLKIEDIERETVAAQGVKVAMIPVGESRIELLEPTNPQSPIARFINEKGEGIHHLALGVDDINAALESLKGKGFPLIDTTPRSGAGGSKIAFMHPKATKALLEFVEHHE